MTKALFKGTFNWYGEIHTVHKHAVSETQAFRLMTKELERILQRDRLSIMFYFLDKDNHKIERGEQEC